MINNLIKRFELGRNGSALIMTVVLTALLSIIAVMFVAVARMDMAATSNIADNKMLESAARSIVEIIGKELVLDTPGVAGQEYYDYPDANNAWLASLEPYKSGTDYFWRQISDIGYLSAAFSKKDVPVDPPGSAQVVKDYPEIKLNTDGSIWANDSWADADGDGIADSKWFELPNMRTSKGKKIYAAVRVIDNGGMVNVNTAHTFDPTSTDPTKIDGTSQMQVNLKGLLKGTDTIENLQIARCGSEVPTDWAKYKKNVIWDYNSIPGGNYLPFDISDELELRYRYCINSKFKSRFEVKDPCTAKTYGNPGSLYDASSDWGLSDWKNRITEPNKVDRRHLLTAYNLDRIITPSGGKMTNINNAGVKDVNSIIYQVIPNAAIAAQIAVNIIDYRDNDSDVCNINVNGTVYYGFERPCIYISELAYNSDSVGPGHTSYAIELCNPYSDQIDPGNGWKLNGLSINWSGTDKFYVVRQQDASLLTVAPGVTVQEPGFTFNDGDPISLTRTVVVGGAPTDIVVDSIGVPPGLVNHNNIAHSFQRNIAPAKCIRRLWGLVVDGSHTLGLDNTGIPPEDSIYIQAHPKNNLFTNIGEIGMILCRDAYEVHSPKIDSSIPPADVFIDLAHTNLANPNYQKIFNYLTVIDPYTAVIPANPAYINETRVKGRININTAPAYVLAQLPWVSQRRGGYSNTALAQAIVAYRDRTRVLSGDPNYRNRFGTAGIGSIGELCNVTRGSDSNYGIDYYSRFVGDQPGFPDLTPPSPTAIGDGAIDDFEERDLIFARISDLVTVRSDVFTAYMLVRIGTDGPQKRYMVILDRSGVRNAGDKVYVRAFQTVPEAR